MGLEIHLKVRSHWESLGVIVYMFCTRSRRFYFQDTILPVLLSAMPLLLNLLKMRHSDHREFFKTQLCEKCLCMHVRGFGAEARLRVQV